jgi:predicted transposase/invertase (TIGR01784 family)
MAFADLKNDFVFRRIFATHPDILRGLLNDLLERHGEQAIASIEYLPSEQLPLVVGAKLSILDVRCKDAAGATFVVEMQLIHVPGFVNRVVYNACKAYVGQLKAGERYTALADVVAISICDFELWPDAGQDEQKLPRVPMLSRWYMREHASGSPGLLQVQYAFLELPKLPEERPPRGADLWAWLFVHAPDLDAMPPDLPSGPHREALELANKATFSQADLDAYQKVMDEIEQAREYGEVKWAEGLAEGHKSGLAEGHKSGLAEGLATGKRDALLRLLARRGLTPTEEERGRISACTEVATLDRWFDDALVAETLAELFS